MGLIGKAGLAAAAAAVGSCAPAPAPPAPPGPIPELAGRTAGAPEHCVSTDRSRALRVAADGRTLLYGSGSTIWVNRLPVQCGPFDRKYVLIVEMFGNRYCRDDRVRSVDPLSGIQGPSCLLEDFVPYRR